MKRKFERFLREYFSYSKKERNGMLVLAGILFCLVAARILVWYIPSPPLESGLTDWIKTESSVFEEAEPVKETRPGFSETHKLFPFDPNLASQDQLMLLGFSQKQATGLIRFRDKGAIFRKKEDLLKLYVMTPALYARIEPWIQISSEEKIYPEKNVSRNEPLSRPKPCVNLSDSVVLTALPGIGAYSASKIIRYRDWLGGFYDTAQYREINGLREEIIQALKDHASLCESHIIKLPINSISEKDLWKHPYIRNKAKVIVSYRNEHGPFSRPEDLMNTGVVDEVLLRKLLPYLQVP